MPAITITDLNNAKSDVDHIAAIATSTAPTAIDRLGNVKKTVAGAVDTIAAFNSRGAWATATIYAVKDLVSNAGTWYACVVAHTSSASFATDTASKWRVYQGVTAVDLAAPGASAIIGGVNQVVASITALRALLKTSASKNAFVTGYYAAGDGGGGAYYYDAADTTTADNGGTVIVAADGGRWKLQLNGVLLLKQVGAKCDGTADDTAALVAADAQAVAAKVTLSISGTPLIKTPLVFATKSAWRFEGTNGTTSSDRPASYLIKHATVLGDLLTFSAGGVVLDGLAIVGQAGNTGNGLTLWGHSPQVLRPFVTLMGQDGIRVGRDSLAGSNVNCFYITNPRCVSNGRDGIHLSDKPTNTFGLYDANAGILHAPRCSNNARHGIYGGAARLGNVILSPTCEANTQYGIYLSNLFYENKIIGGDTEANGAGDLFQTNKYDNDISGLLSTGKNVNTRAVIGSYIPVVTGGTTAGACTYTTQLGSREVSGPTCHFRAHIAWTGHTGTGQPFISLPEQIYVTVPAPDYIPVQIISSGISVAAGAQIVGLILRDSNRLQLYQSSAGVLSAISVTAAGELYISGSYPINAPNSYTA